MQKKYLDQIEELYDEFNVVKMPLLVEEVRGKEKLEQYVYLLLPLISTDMAQIQRDARETISTSCIKVGHKVMVLRQDIVLHEVMFTNGDSETRS